MRNEAGERFRTTDLGMVKINNNAISTIASIAALEVKGVHKIGGGFGRTLSELFMHRSGSKGVKIHMHENELKLTIYIIVEYGVDIPRIADETQDNVKQAVEKMTGLVISGVDVIVEGVRHPAAAQNFVK